MVIDMPSTPELGVIYTNTRREDHPGLLLVNNMMEASKLRDALRRFLVEHKVRRLSEYRLMVDFSMRPDKFAYEYCLRVFPIHSKVPVLTLWSDNRQDMTSDEHMALLLVLFNS